MAPISTRAASSLSRSRPRPSRRPLITTEQQVLFSAAAAVALPPAKTRRFRDAVHAVTGALRGVFAATEKSRRTLPKAIRSTTLIAAAKSTRLSSTSQPIGKQFRQCCVCVCSVSSWLSFLLVIHQTQFFRSSNCESSVSLHTLAPVSD